MPERIERTEPLERISDHHELLCTSRYGRTISKCERITLNERRSYHSETAMPRKRTANEFHNLDWLLTGELRPNEREYPRRNRRAGRTNSVARGEAVRTSGIYEIPHKLSVLERISAWWITAHFF